MVRSPGLKAAPRQRVKGGVAVSTALPLSACCSRLRDPTAWHASCPGAHVLISVQRVPPGRPGYDSGGRGPSPTPYPGVLTAACCRLAAAGGCSAPSHLCHLAVRAVCSCGEHDPCIPRTLGGPSALLRCMAGFPHVQVLHLPLMSQLPGRGSPLPLPVQRGLPPPRIVFLPKVASVLRWSSLGGTAAHSVIYRGAG